AAADAAGGVGSQDRGERGWVLAARCQAEVAREGKGDGLGNGFLAVGSRQVAEDGLGVALDDRQQGQEAVVLGVVASIGRGARRSCAHQGHPPPGSRPGAGDGSGRNRTAPAPCRRRKATREALAAPGGVADAGPVKGRSWSVERVKVRDPTVLSY